MPDRPRPEHTRGGHTEKKPSAPEPTGFASFGLLPQLLRNIEKAGWVMPSPIQQELIPLAMQGHDLYGVAQTGTGKTAAFALPVLHALADLPPAPKLQPYCMVLAPTRELAQQIEQQFALLGEGLKIRSAAIFGGVSDRPQITALNNGVEVVVAAPGRLLDLLGQGWINFASLRVCVLDEADRMFDMGFINDIKKILNRTPSSKQTLLLSATMPSAIKQLAAEFLYYPREVRIGMVAPPTQLRHELWPMSSEDKNARLTELLTSTEIDSAVVFCRTRSRADSLARRLGRAGERVAALHSDRTQNQRDKALAQFKNGEVRVLVATDVASRGLDVEGIQIVVNYDVPLDPEDYVHRVGRTARAKREGKAVTFAAPEESKYVQRIEKFLNKTIERVYPDGGVHERSAEVLPSGRRATARDEKTDLAKHAGNVRNRAQRKDPAKSGNQEHPARKGRQDRSVATLDAPQRARRAPKGDDSYVEDAPAPEQLLTSSVTTSPDGSGQPRRRRSRGGRGRGKGDGAASATSKLPLAGFDDSVGE
jgi:ATP-dependent RNA helicase RhlE